MNDQRVCLPLDTEGNIRGRLGQARTVVTCHLTDEGVAEWTEHSVDWDNDYGVTVHGVHHPRVVKFLRRNEIDLVMADEVCDSIKNTLAVLGIVLREKVTGDPRAAVGMLAAA